MTTVWLVLATLAIAPFFVGPLFIYYKWLTSSMPDIVRVHTDQQHMPAEFDSFTQDGLRALYPAGFQFAAAAIVMDGAPNQRFVSLLENPRTRDVAILTLCAKGRRKRHGITWAIQTKSVEFISEFSDGKHISTENPGYIHGWGTQPSMRLALPGYDNTAALYDLHRAFVNKAAPRNAKCRVTEGRPLDYLRAIELKDVYHGIERHDLFLDEETGLVHPTLKGAVRKGLAEFTPLFWIRMAINYQRAFRLTAKFGSPLPQRQPALSLSKGPLPSLRTV